MEDSIPKDYTARLKSTISANFNIAKESSLAKGTISAINNIFGVNLNTINGEVSDGVLTRVRTGRIIKSQKPPDGTLAAASKTDEPFTIVDGKGTSRYYNTEFESEKYVSTGAGDTKKTITVGKKPYSAFNKYSLINYRGNPLDISENGFGIGDKGDKGNIYQKIDQTSLINPTVTKIIEITSSLPGNSAYIYQYSDFALAKYFGRIPNNMLITLRRFAYPTKDDIITPSGLTADGTGMVPIQQPDIARAVTWLGESTGNTLAEILKFSHGFSFETASAGVQEITAKTKESTGKFGSFVENSTVLSALANTAAGRDAVASNSRKQNASYDSFKETYPNHVFGPLNVIKDVLVRQPGLKFEQEFSLKFEYELRSFEGANPKIMMLDQLSNILALTYNNAPFWGGSVRYISDGAITKPLGNLNLLRGGDYAGFMGSIIKDMGSMFKGATSGVGNSFEKLLSGDIEGGLAALKGNKFLNNLIGGSAMEMFNTPQGAQAVNSLLTGDPTGQWHLTVGNPLNPIMVIGNLCMTDCEINFEGVNTLQDFPEKMVVVIKLKPGRPRDKAEIESMFNSGRGRFYVQPHDTADINQTIDVSAYGNKDLRGERPKTNDFINTFRKISNG
jgi:hypothetical protein